MARHRFERDDLAVIEHAVAQEVVILADIGADIEHAVDLEAYQKLTQMQRKVALAHLAQRHDVVPQRAADLEHRILDDLEHDDLQLDPWECRRFDKPTATTAVDLRSTAARLVTFGPAPKSLHFRQNISDQSVIVGFPR